jgi:hypothetical protein
MKPHKGSHAGESQCGFGINREALCVEERLGFIFVFAKKIGDGC